MFQARVESYYDDYDDTSLSQSEDAVFSTFELATRWVQYKLLNMMIGFSDKVLTMDNVIEFCENECNGEYVDKNYDYYIYELEIDKELISDEQIKQIESEHRE